MLHFIDYHLLLEAMSAIGPKHDWSDIASQELGWSDADTAALCPPVAQAPSEAAGTAKSKASSATAKKPAITDKKAAAATASTVLPMSDEIVTGLEAPCHVAVIKCHQDAVVELTAALNSCLVELRNSMYSWQNNEQTNKVRWAALLKSLNDLV